MGNYLRESRSAIRLTDSTDSSFTPLDKSRKSTRAVIHRSSSVFSDYSERNSLPDKTSARRGYSGFAPEPLQVNTLLQPTVTPAPLLKRSYPKHKSLNYSLDSSLTSAANLARSTSAEIKKNEIDDNTDKTSLGFSPSDAQNTNNPEFQRFSKNVFMTLSDIQSTTSSDDKKMEAITTLQQVLTDANALKRTCPMRAEILKDLYRVLNNSPALLAFKVSDIILKLRPSGKNLGTVLKILYRLSEDVTNDDNILDPVFFGEYVSVLQELPTTKYPQALLYSYALLKNVVQNEHFLKVTDEVPTLCRAISKHLSGLSRLMQRKPQKHEPTTATFIYLLEVVKTMCETPELLSHFYSSEQQLVSDICGALAVCMHESEITKLIVNILSLLANYEECCDAISRNSFCYAVFIQILKKYFANPYIVDRVCYIMGSLSANKEKSSLKIYQTSQSLDVILSLLHHYVSSQRSENQKYKGHGKGISDDKENCGVIVQVIRIIANLCVIEEVGYSLAKHSLCVDMLTEILSPNVDFLDREVLEIAIETLGNLSFFLGNELLPSTVILTERLVASISNLTFKKDPNLISGIYLALGNLTQNIEARKVFLKKQIFSKLLSSLEASFPPLAYYSAGIILNLIVEKESRAQFHQEMGVGRVTALLRDLMPDESALGAILCQILWNYTNVEIGHSSNLTNEELRELVQVLEDLLDEKSRWGSELTAEDETVKERWETQFSKLAIHLLDFLTGGVAQI